MAELHGRLWRVVCSSQWEDDLYALFVRGILIISSEAKAPKFERILSRAPDKWVKPADSDRHYFASSYPPGGDSTLMVRCPVCNWLPPQSIGSTGVCMECTADVPDELSAITPANGPLDRAQSQEAIGRGELREHPAAKKRLPPREGVHWYGEREAGAAMLEAADAQSRSRRHRLYLYNDPRVAGGPIDQDGVMRDPWLGYLPWIGWEYPEPRTAGNGTDGT